MQRYAAIKDSHSEQRLYRSRLFLSLTMVVIFFCVLAYRYADLQIFQYDSFVTQSERNRVHVQPVAPKRSLPAASGHCRRRLWAVCSDVALLVALEALHVLEPLLARLRRLDGLP